MEPVTIALDAMGGDDAPQIVVAGANIARRRYPHVNFLLYGDEQPSTMKQNFSIYQSKHFMNQM